MKIFLVFAIAAALVVLDLSRITTYYSNNINSNISYYHFRQEDYKQGGEGGSLRRLSSNYNQEYGDGDCSLFEKLSHRRDCRRKSNRLNDDQIVIKMKNDTIPLSSGLPDPKTVELKSHTEPQQIIMTKPPTSFFYIHCPKTGTSLYTVLRNSLESCTHKHFTCFGVFGGGYWGKQIKGGKDIYPHDYKIMFGPNITKREAEGINTCHGSLNCQSNHYHCAYRMCKSRENKVTMIRNPYKWLPSYANFMWPFRAYSGKSIEGDLPFQSQMSFISDTNNVKEAIDILQNDYVYWGIADYWEVSICIFHCKFGGTTTDSELQNIRSAGDVLPKTQEDFTMKIPLVEDIIRNVTQYVDVHYQNDVILYSRLLDLFWERAGLCGCSTSF